MEMNITYGNVKNYNELAYLTSKISDEGCIINETYYYVDATSGFKVKAYFRYENYDTNPATGIYVKIINPQIGVIDAQLFDFSTIYSGTNDRKERYWLREKTGWNGNPPTNEQRENLATEIKRFVGIYSEHVNSNK